MGGCCCCCSSGGSEGRNSPDQRVVEERVPLSPNMGVAPPISAGLLVDTNLETSIIVTYRPPPWPVPYDVDLGHPLTPPITRETVGNKTDTVAQARGAESVESSTRSTFASTEKLEDLSKDAVKIEIALTAKLEIGLSKSMDSIPSFMEEEDVCPICLEEYDAENPKMMTRCDHHFHLACILEWRERRLSRLRPGVDTSVSHRHITPRQQPNKYYFTSLPRRNHITELLLCSAIIRKNIALQIAVS